MTPELRALVLEYLAPRGEIYTQVREDGSVLVFDVTAMRQHADEGRPGAKTYVIDIDEALLRHIGQNTIETARVAMLMKLAETRTISPALGILGDDGKTYIIDGNHRIHLWAGQGHRQCRMILFDVDAWRPYLLDLPGELVEYLKADTKRPGRNPL